jgi:HK97 family phage portal protein
MAGFPATPSQPTIADFLRAGVTSGGRIVSPTSILSHPAVWRGVDLISTSVARIPFDVYVRGADGSRSNATDHDAMILKRQPNGLYSRFQLIKSWVVETLTHGDGFIYIERRGNRPIKLWLLESASTSVRSDSSGITYTTTDRNGQRMVLDSSQVLHLRGLGNDGLTGLPIYQILAEGFGLGLTLQRYQRAFFDNYGRPSVAIKLPPEVTSREDVEEFREAWMAKHGGGPETAFTPAMLRPGADLVEMKSDNAIESLVNLREHDLVTIANCLGLPPHRIGAKSVSVSYGSLEQENLSFLQDIDGWTTQAEQEFSLKLLRTDEQETHYIEGNREALVMPDSETKANLLALYRRNGMMSDEQIANKTNIPRDPNGTYWVEANLIERSKALRDDPEPVNQEPAPEDSDDENVDDPTRSLSMALTESIVGRLQRRAVKSGKIESNLWEEELGSLPGWSSVAAYLDVMSPEKLETKIITENLWTT